MDFIIALSAFSAPDPYMLSPAQPNDLIYTQTAGSSLRSAAINTGMRNLVLIVAGQSNRASVNPTLYTPTNASVIDVLNINDGALYSIAGPLLGCSYEGTAGGLGPGNIAARVADLLITNGKFDRVILAPIAVGGTFAAEWATGGRLANRVAVVMARLAARGIVPGMAGVTFALEWGHGETDTSNGTSQSSYATSLASIISNTYATGFNGRFFVALETWTRNGTTSSGIRAAQAGVVNNTTVFQSGDIDTLGAPNRVDAVGHLNDIGAAAAATLIFNAMHASGSPY